MPTKPDWPLHDNSESGRISRLASDTYYNENIFAKPDYPRYNRCDFALVEDFLVAGWLQTKASRSSDVNESARIVEPELDMNRPRPEASTVATRLRDFIRWLVPINHMVGTPMRSVDRERQETWPS